MIGNQHEHCESRACEDQAGPKDLPAHFPWRPSPGDATRLPASRASEPVAGRGPPSCRGGPAPARPEAARGERAST
jgi:hypothetical protein